MTTIGRQDPDNARRSPEQVLLLVREVFDGRIDLDPATDLEANESVGAAKILTSAEDGLRVAWPSSENCFCNPPGGVDDQRRSKAAIWFRRFAFEASKRTFNQGIFLAFNIELLRITQQFEDWACALNYPVCYPAERLRFPSPAGKNVSSPSCANALIYIGSNATRFCDVFSALGKVVVPNESM